MDQPNQPVSSSTTYKQITEELYKKNLDLFNSNQALALLQKLYRIVVSSDTLDKISQEFIDVIVKDLNFIAGLVFLVDKQQDTLEVIAGTGTPLNQAILKELNLPQDKLVVPLTGVKNFLTEAVRSKQKLVTTNYFDVWDAWLGFDKRKNVEAVIKSENVQTTFVYPILLRGDTLGVFTLSSTKLEQEISMFEQGLFNEVANVFGIGIDRVMLYINLREVNKKLQELDARKDEFLSIATHELRAPMTAIKGYLSMLLDGDAGKMAPDAETFLKVAASSTDRLIRLVNNMLNIARIEQGRQVYQMDSVRLSSVVDTIFREFQLEAEKRKLDYVLAVQQQDIDDRVYVDPDRVHEVVANLISNAIKYTDQGKIEVKLFNPNPQAVRFEVVDTGMGIGPKDQGNVFQKYFRVEERMERKTGTGLGLYISKVLVEKFKGRIGFASELGKGSTFWFELPVITDTENMPKVLV